MSRVDYVIVGRDDDVDLDTGIVFDGTHLHAHSRSFDGQTLDSCTLEYYYYVRQVSN